MTAGRMTACVGGIGGRGFLAVVCVVWLAAVSVNAQPTPISEVTITGETGALLSVDGTPVGRLPLSGPLPLSAGPHRFMMEHKGHRYASDLLQIPEGREAELRLTRGNQGTAIALLSLRPMILLVLRAEDADENLRQALSASVQEGARAEYTMLIPAERAEATQAALNGGADCMSRDGCRRDAAEQSAARMIFILSIPNLAKGDPAGSRCGIVGELVDVSTDQTAAKGATDPACLPPEAPLLEAVARLSRKLIREAGAVAKGNIVVTTNPAGARVTVDDRRRGESPWQGPSLVGKHAVRIEKEGYVPQRLSIEVLAGQSATLSVELVSTAPLIVTPPVIAPPHQVSVLAGERAPRPRWRPAVGGLAVGVGLLTAGFGISALASHSDCADLAQETPNCDQLLNTRGIGAGLMAVGLGVALGGGALLAVPGPRTRSRSSP